MTVPATPEPITLDTDRTALIVVDMQNAFARKGGMLDIMAAYNEARVNRVIENNKVIVAPYSKECHYVYHCSIGEYDDLFITINQLNHGLHLNRALLEAGLTVRCWIE